MTNETDGGYGVEVLAGYFAGLIEKNVDLRTLEFICKDGRLVEIQPREPTHG